VKVYELHMRIEVYGDLPASAEQIRSDVYEALDDADFGFDVVSVEEVAE
jgi:hypothetical protein